MRQFYAQFQRNIGNNTTAEVLFSSQLKSYIVKIQLWLTINNVIINLEPCKTLGPLVK